MKKNFTKANIIIENRKNVIHPAMFIIEDEKLYMEIKAPIINSM